MFGRKVTFVTRVTCFCYSRNLRRMSQKKCIARRCLQNPLAPGSRPKPMMLICGDDLTGSRAARKPSVSPSTGPFNSNLIRLPPIAGFRITTPPGPSRESSFLTRPCRRARPWHKRHCNSTTLTRKLTTPWQPHISFTGGTGTRRRRNRERQLSSIQTSRKPIIFTLTYCWR